MSEAELLVLCGALSLEGRRTCRSQDPYPAPLDNGLNSSLQFNSNLLSFFLLFFFPSANPSVLARKDLRAERRSRHELDPTGNESKNAEMGPKDSS